MRMRKFNIYLIKRIIREHGGDMIFKKIMTDNFSKLMQDVMQI